MTTQYLRKFSLVVSNAGTALELSEFRCVFKVNQSDCQSPNNANVKIYNLSDQTAQQIQKEFTRITLQAGYENGPYGVIFDGTVRRVFRGKDVVPSIRINRETPTETYLEINAGEGDDPYNSATINKSLAAGTTQADQIKALADSAKLTVYDPFQFGAVTQNLRGVVLFGMARDYLRAAILPSGWRWSVNGKGQLVLIPNTAYLPGEAVVLNSQTGLIGMPQQTQDGLVVDALLNPKIQIGCALKINNADVVKQGFDPGYRAFNFPPPTSADGLYRVLVAEHQGDTRNEPWYTHMIALSIDPSSSIQNSVKAAG